MRGITNRPVVAIFSPAANVVSETFIRAHLEKIDSEIIFYSDGAVPTKVNAQQVMRFKFQLKYFLGKRARPFKGLTLEEYALKQSLKDRRPDMVLCEYGMTAHSSLRVIKELGIPMLVHFHGYDMSVREVFKATNNYKDVIAYASKLFVVSRDMERKIIDCGSKPEQTVYNPYGPNDSYFKIVPRAKKKALFLAAGRFTNKKAPYITILAFKKVLEKHPDARLILGGDGELHQVCRDLVAYNKMERSVEFTGIFNETQMKEWLTKAIAFVQHSVTAENGDQEGTPVAILEAMASGLPVVSTRHAGIKDVVREGETGYLVDEYDIAGMASMMCKILEDKNKSRVMGRTARKFISENLKMDTHIGRINQAVYEIYNSR